MNKFAFMIHPIDISDVSRKFKIASKLPDSWVEGAVKYIPSLKVSHITGVKSAHSEIEGWFVGCPLTTRQMLNLPPDYVLQKIIKTGRLAEKLGAQILGLGAMTSVVGDAGVTVAKNLGIAVTTGNSYTVATAMEGTRKAAQMMGIELEKAEIAVIGATGSIGAVCARLMAKETKYLTLVARSEDKLDRLAAKIMEETGLAVKVTRNIKEAIRRAKIIITVTSDGGAVIEPEDLLPGAVVCDVARPRDVSKKVVETRDDVLVIEGGVVEVPGNVNFNFNFGFPPKTSYACMAETMMLALEGRLENFTLGRDLSLEQVEETERLAAKHGFKLAGFRSFERAILPEQIDAIRERAKKLGSKGNDFHQPVNFLAPAAGKGKQKNNTAPNPLL
ncbi:MAG: shikimate dehydrogenase [Syntrophomonadaceae bacterium]|nr:shikimate dehydrogenase [Syntrophomonadaceae bacterium]